MFQLNFHALDAATSTSAPSARKGAAYPQRTLMVRACNPLDHPGFSLQGFDGLAGLTNSEKMSEINVLSRMSKSNSMENNDKQTNVVSNCYNL